VLTGQEGNGSPGRTAAGTGGEPILRHQQGRAERRVVLFPHPEPPVHAIQFGQVLVEPPVPDHDDPVRRLVEAMPLGGHRGREHRADLGLSHEEKPVEISHRQVRNRFSQEEWRWCGGGVCVPV
jgi:hypothetical protein